MDPMQNLNNAADALNQVAQRAGAFWDQADAQIAQRQAAYDALGANLIDVADGRHHFVCVLDPASDGSQTGNGGTYPTLQSIFADAPDYCFLQINLLDDAVIEVDQNTLTGFGQDVTFFYTEAANKIANRPVLRFTTYAQNGFNYKNRIRLKRGSSLSFRSVNVEITGKADAALPWSMSAGIQGWYFDPVQVGFYKCGVSGADGVSVMTSENGAPIIVNAFQVEIDGDVALADVARGCGLISTYTITLSNGGQRSRGGTLGVNLIEK